MKVLWILALTASVASALRFDNQCPPEQEDNWEIEMLLRHEDCDKFYKCTFGQPVVQQCPADLYFNLELWQCDWKENVDCTDRNVPGETPEPTPAPTSPPTTRPTTAPTTRPTTAPTTRPTTAPTTRPTTAPTTRPTTAPTTRPTTAPTTRPTTAPTTRPTTAPTTRPTPAPTPAPTPDPDFLENGCPVSGMVHWLLPHEKDCNLFYYCVWGQKVLRQCPSSLHFNRVIQVCDWPNRAGCLTSCNKHAEGRRAIAREV